MDNRSPRRAPTLRFSPNRWVALGLLAVCLAFAVLCWTATDRPGRVLYGLVAVVVAGVCATDLLWRPRLTVSAQGVTVRSPSVRATLPWSAIQFVRVDERRRVGLAARTLEIDADDQLVVLSQRSLGTDPREVAALMSAFQRGD